MLNAEIITAMTAVHDYRDTMVAWRDRCHAAGIDATYYEQKVRDCDAAYRALMTLPATDGKF